MTDMGNRSNQEYAGLDGMVWFVGVVEDRRDPLHIGRVRVRCHGWHSNSREEVPTSQLPWASVLNPITNAAVSGVGTSATGMVEGTLVMGHFLDGKNAQQPIIWGSIAGVPQLGPGRGEAGHTDPNALYPIPTEVGKPDTPKLAYDRWEEDPISIAKESHRVSSIPTAEGPALSRVSRQAAIAAGSWDEPEQRGGKSRYPFNHVTQTESGHAREMDDTVGGERIHEYHRTGSFYEIQPDGSKITKIVGSDYEIIVKDKNVLINGACNVTIKGDSRILVEGNKIEEIRGDYHLTVHGSRLVKTLGNDLEETSGDRSSSIGKNETTLVAGDKSATIAGKEDHSVGKDLKETIKQKETKIVGTELVVSAGQKITQVAGQSFNLGAGTDLNIAAGSIITTTDVLVKGTSTAEVDHISGPPQISGAYHTHQVPAGVGAKETLVPTP